MFDTSMVHVVYEIIILLYTISFKTLSICAKSTQMDLSSNYVSLFKCHGCFRLYCFFSNLSILSLLIRDFIPKSKLSQENEGCLCVGGIHFACSASSIRYWNCSDTVIFKKKKKLKLYSYIYFFAIFDIILDSITLNPIQYLLLYNYFSQSVGGLESIYS